MARFLNGGSQRTARRKTESEQRMYLLSRVSRLSTGGRSSALTLIKRDRRAHRSVGTIVATKRLARSLVKSILLHVDLLPSSVSRLGLALALADQLGASLTLLFGTGPTPLQSSFAYSAGGYAEALDERPWEALRSAARRELERHLPSDAALTWGDVGSHSVAESVIQEAAYADLVILGNHEPEAEGLAPPAGFVESVIMESGRPVLVVPGGHRRSDMGRRALVAWNGTAPAARALTAALPLLRMAERVDVVGWSAHPLSGRFSGLDIGHFLARHGVDAAVHRLEPVRHVGAEIPRLARQFGADLVVMGCYGHGRLREHVLGGASQSMLRAMMLPTLMAH